MNYGQLKTAIASWVNHGAATASIPDFVDLAEAEIRRDVRVMAMESLASGSLAAGVVALPTGYLDARQFVVNGLPCDYITPEEYQTQTYQQSRQNVYTRIGSSLYVINGGTQTYSLIYRASFAALSADADTNWLLTNAPDVYLFCALKHAAIFLKDAAAAQGYEGLYQAARSKTTSADSAGAVSGPMRMRARVVA
jgi:hypothetical protein